ncbi:hypothetical protein POTOM_050184 [Populus tomentosa]|uniref:NAD(P)-binding Rossmann-fold superfamily protein n=1 Tax=Populus tomentosa TaxID=118781 RepID=A0A8X7YBR8_POPTO|nr:hypothetical protein POTOM_050184 [Populus tomentosa]
METTPSESSSTPSTTVPKKKQGLGWIEWLRGWMYIIYEMLFQRIMASHLQNPLSLPPINNLTCIVTGSTSGIGLQIARQLAESGAHVVMAVRNTKAAHDLIHKWQSEWTGLGLPLNIEVMELDLLSLESVSRFAEVWNARMGPLHVLINNAGIFSIRGYWQFPSITGPQKFSKDGYEEHMQVNHLAPALLSILLLPSLIRGSPSRIINVNSVMHYIGFVDTEDMNVISGKRKYTSLVGYTGSKLAQVMFSSVLHRRLPAESGISVLCVSPGVVQTNVARDLPKIVQAGYHLIPYFIFNAQEAICKGFELLKMSNIQQFRRVVHESEALWKSSQIHFYAELIRLAKPSSLFGTLNRELGSRSALFSATDPQIPEYCELLKSDDWPVCAFISQDCRPTNPSEEAHNIDTAYKVWEKTLEMIGLPSDAIEKLIEGEEVRCRYGERQE